MRIIVIHNQNPKLFIFFNCQNILQFKICNIFFKYIKCFEKVLNIETCKLCNIHRNQEKSEDLTFHLFIMQEFKIFQNDLNH